MSNATSLSEPPYQVGITFQNATLKLGGDTLENRLSSKADADHNHDIANLLDATNKLSTLTSDCIKVDSGAASITGNFTCKDLYFTHNFQSTSLDSIVTKLDGTLEMTIQHLTLTADSNVRVGYPVFYTGEIIGKNFTLLTVSSTDCVPIVKASGDWNTFAGICTEVDCDYYGKTTQKYKGKEHAFIRFATHGDFQMAVDDSSKYKVGDLIKYNGEIVNTDDVVDYKTMMSIVGSITAIVNDTSIAVFRI